MSPPRNHNPVTHKSSTQLVVSIFMEELFSFFHAAFANPVYRLLNKQQANLLAKIFTIKRFHIILIFRSSLSVLDSSGAKSVIQKKPL